jgi:hypothetical protein
MSLVVVKPIVDLPSARGSTGIAGLATPPAMMQFRRDVIAITHFFEPLCCGTA